MKNCPDQHKPFKWEEAIQWQQNKKRTGFVIFVLRFDEKEKRKILKLMRPSNNNNKRQQKLNNNNRFCLIAFEQQQWQYRQHYAWWSVCVLSNYALHSEAARGRNRSECKQFYVILLYYFLDVTIRIHCIAFLLLHFCLLLLFLVTVLVLFSNSIEHVQFTCCFCIYLI